MDGYVKQKLGKRIKERLQEIQDYRSSTIFAKSIDPDLHEKMVEAEKKSFHALYGDLPKDFFEDEDNSSENNNDEVSNNLGFKSQPTKRSSCKQSNTGNKACKVRIRHSRERTTKNNDDADLDKVKFQQKAFNESFRILMKEYDNRKATRIRQKAVKFKVKNKFLAVWSLRKQQHEKKQNSLGLIRKEKIEKILGVCSFINQIPEGTNNEGKEEVEDHKNDDDDDDSQNGLKGEERYLSGVNTKTDSADPNITNEGKIKSVEEPIKRKVEVIDLKALLDLKRKQLNPENEFYVKNTKMVEAKIQLLRIQEFAEDKRNNSSSYVFNVDNQNDIPKLKKVIFKVMRVNARDKATKRISECSSFRERTKDENGKGGNEGEVEGMMYQK